MVIMYLTESQFYLIIPHIVLSKVEFMVEKTAEEILKEAGVAANALLPKLEQERETALKKLHDIERNISLLHAVSTSSASISGQSFGFSGTPIVAPGGIGLSAPSPGIGLENERVDVLLGGQSLMDRIKVVLRIHPDSLPKQIADEIKTLYGYEPPQSSLYAALQRGKSRGTLIETNSLWNVKR